MGETSTKPPHAMQLVRPGCDGRQDDAQSAASRRTDDVSVLDAKVLHKAQDTFSIASQRALVGICALRKAATGQIHGVDGKVSRERRDVESPGEGVAHEAVYQQQRRARAGKQIAPRHPVKGHTALFRTGYLRNLRNVRRVGSACKVFVMATK
jgi:hypothetical protein